VLAPDGVIATLSLDSGTVRTISDPGPGDFDLQPAISGDGRTVLFARSLAGSDDGVHALMRVPIGGGHETVAAVVTPAAQHNVMDWDTGGPRAGAAARDHQAPAVLVGGAGLTTAVLLAPAGARAARAPLRAAARRALSFLAVDRSGVSGVALALRKRTGGRCRNAGPAGLGPATSCSAPRFLTLRSSTALRAIAARLPAGRYELLARTTDRRGNRTQGALTGTIQLR
jgi:hypothetical protein